MQTSHFAAAEGRHLLKFTSEQTKIPTAMVTVGDTLYMHYMSVHGFADMGGVWLCNSSRFIASKDGGKTWDKGVADFGNFQSSFNMLALSAQAGTGNEDGKYVYAVGTPCGRFNGARVGRVVADKLMDNAAWEYWDGAAWVAERNGAHQRIDWRFTTADARIKLKHLYPTFHESRTTSAAQAVHPPASLGPDASTPARW